MSGWMRDITAEDFRKWVATASTDDLETFFDEADLKSVIEDLEQDDFFGTEGFDKRFA